MSIFAVGKIQIFLVALGFVVEGVALLMRLITGSPTPFIWWTVVGFPVSAILASIIGPTASRRRIAVSWRWALGGILLYYLGVVIASAIAFVVLFIVFITYAGDPG